MATTTNYSWTTPDDTALVKDGAAAIRSLGSAIDTTVFNNANAAIAKTIVDAKGDIIAATAADTVARLAVGANDTVLTADSSTATGLKWATPAAGGMTLLTTGTLSGASVTLSSISGSYKDLILDIIAYDPSNDAALIEGRFNSDSTSNYQWNETVNGNLGSASTQFELFNNVQDNGTSTSFVRLFIPAYTNTLSWKAAICDAFLNDATSPASVINYSRTAIMWRNTAAIDSIYLQTSAGTFSGGTYNLYGVS